MDTTTQWISIGDDQPQRIVYTDPYNNNQSVLVNTTAMWDNCTWCNSTSNGNDTHHNYQVVVDIKTALFTLLYALICITGLLGNGLVIFVVLRYAKMKTVTNMYILNLAVADLCFLIGLPFLIITSILRYWIFGFIICKLFYISTSINWFSSVFTFTAMSADRYLAICHPIASMKYRTPIISRVVCACVWTASFLAMLPIILYANTVNNPDNPGQVSCNIVWPNEGAIPNELAFIWYAFLLGFAIPVLLISIFYTCVIYKLQYGGMSGRKKGKEKKKSHRKVTKMVLTVIAVYVVCWLPYWVFQLLLNYIKMSPVWALPLFQFLTVMSYANSMMNPVLYAFLSENFRKSFAKAFKCATKSEVNGMLHAEQSVAAPGRKTHTTVTTTGDTVSLPMQIQKMQVKSSKDVEKLTNVTVSNNGTSTTTAIVDDNTAETSAGGTNRKLEQEEDLYNSEDDDEINELNRGPNGITEL